MFKMTEQHIKREALGLYILGDLPVRDTLATEEHLAFCEHCRDTLDGMAAVVAALRNPPLDSGIYAVSRG